MFPTSSGERSNVFGSDVASRDNVSGEEVLRENFFVIARFFLYPFRGLRI